ncbi:MAG: hypothetical protein GY869_29040, partial [Planctomycetes bacterium]|nr:hypothetical protein [Planctomycetota bacterium]
MSYFSSIRNLFNPAHLPTHLGAVSYLIDDLPLDDLLEQVFYRNLRHYANAYGDKITYTLDLVLLEGLGLDMPFPGFRLDLNGDPSLDNATVIPLSLTYQLPILRYVDRFEPDMADFTPADYYEFLLTITQVAPNELLLAVLEVMIDDQNPVQAFIDRYETTNPSLSIVIDPGPEVTIQNLVTALESAAVDLFQYIFDAYL